MAFVFTLKKKPKAAMLLQKSKPKPIHPPRASTVTQSYRRFEF